MNYIQSTLLPNEKLVFFTNQHFIIFFPSILWTIATIVFMFITPSKYNILVYAFGFAALYSISAAIISYMTTEYGITDKRILMKVGFISRSSLEMFFNQIESVLVNQSIPGRIFGYGTVIICGTGGNRDFFYFIPSPLDFRKRVQEQIEKQRASTTK